MPHFQGTENVVEKRENAGKKHFLVFQTIFQSPFHQCFNSLPDNKMLDWSKLKSFADYKINVTENWKFVLERVENIVGKEENAGSHNLFKTS